MIDIQITGLVGRSVSLLAAKMHWLFKIVNTSNNGCIPNVKTKIKTNVTWILEVEFSPWQVGLYCHDLGGSIIGVLV
jgi:hypothetical protein